MKNECIREIEELHQFFEDWFTGTIENSVTGFARFSDVIHADFTMIVPNGKQTNRNELKGSLFMMHGKRPNIKIWIEKPEFRYLSSTTAMLTYEEWQKDGEDAEATTRVSTVIFESNIMTKNNVMWLHVHETMRPVEVPFELI